MLQTLYATESLLIANTGQESDKSLLAISNEDIRFPEFRFDAVGNLSQNRVWLA